MPFNDVRRVHRQLRRTFAFAHPCAQVRLKTKGAKHLAELAAASAAIVERDGQITWTAILPNRFEQFDYEHGLALRWYPRGRRSVVLIDPRIAFGAPIIADRGIPTGIIRERHPAGEDLDAIADDFALSRQQIEEALAFERPYIVTVA